MNILFKIITLILIICFYLLEGCTPIQVTSTEEYLTEDVLEIKSCNIEIITNDRQRFQFIDGNFTYDKNSNALKGITVSGDSLLINKGDIYSLSDNRLINEKERILAVELNNEDQIFFDKNGGKINYKKMIITGYGKIKTKQEILKILNNEIDTVKRLNYDNSYIKQEINLGDTKQIRVEKKGTKDNTFILLGIILIASTLLYYLALYLFINSVVSRK